MHGMNSRYSLARRVSALLLCLAMVFSSLCLPPAVAAESTSIFRGVVYDMGYEFDKWALLSGVKVSLQTPDGTTLETVTTGNDGAFSFSISLDESYSLLFSRSGGLTTKKASVTIPAKYDCSHVFTCAFKTKTVMGMADANKYLDQLTEPCLVIKSSSEYYHSMMDDFILQPEVTLNHAFYDFVLSDAEKSGVQLEATVEDLISADAPVILWTSDNPKVASVSPKGYVTALTPGEATITAQVKGTELSADCAVRVAQFGTCFVYFMMNDEKSAIYQTKIVEGGSAVSAPNPAPERKGYHFMGWYANESAIGQEFFQNGATETVTDSVSYYARWVSKSFSIPLDAFPFYNDHDPFTITPGGSVPSTGDHSKTHSIREAHLRSVAPSISADSITKLRAYASNPWEGSCYGISALASIIKYDPTLAQYIANQAGQGDTYWASDLKVTPNWNNTDVGFVESYINMYHMKQFLIGLDQYYTPAKERIDKSFIPISSGLLKAESQNAEEIISVMSSTEYPVVLCIGIGNVSTPFAKK